MPLITCSECGASASTSAKACPGCGAGAKFMRRGKGPWPTTKRGWIVLGFLGLFLLSALMTMVGGTQTPKLKSQADILADQRNRAAYNAVTAVTKSLRDPDSVTFRSVLVDEQGTTACVLYHARNGFGGMGAGHMVFLHGIPSERKSDWNRHCANKSMYELKGIARIAG